MTRLRQVVHQLEAADLHHAVIGAFAMAAHGVVRGTLDLDIAVANPKSALDVGMWASFPDAEVRRGGPTDPLAGVVRIPNPDGLPIDIVVFGPLGWQREAIERATPGQVSGHELPVVTVVDLVRFKLYAGGPQDGWDLQQLLQGHPDAEQIRQELDATVDALPRRSQELWARLVSDTWG